MDQAKFMEDRTLIFLKAVLHKFYLVYYGLSPPFINEIFVENAQDCSDFRKKNWI